MDIRKNLMYTKTHEWVEFTGENTAKIGLTDFAQKSLGNLVFVNLPAEGDELTAGESLGDVESVKAVSDVMSPVSGVVAEVNEELFDAPEKINEGPYDAWMVSVTDVSDKLDLLDPEAYEALCAEEAH